MAMLGAATITSQLVAGKALRDTLFLTSLDVTALPAMLVATSIVSLALVALSGRVAAHLVPAVMVPASFALSGVLFLLEWALRPSAPTASAVVLYLHISAAGPLLASGFWLIAAERFDPHASRHRFGQLAGAETIGGLFGALVAERSAAWFGAPAMLPVLALLQLAGAVLVRRLAGDSSAGHAPQPPESPASTRAGLRVIADVPYLRQLAVLVLLGTTGATLVDYLLKAAAVDTFGRGDQLLRFFALYYAGTSIITFVLQTSSTQRVLERWGVGVATSTPSMALLLGTIGALVAPGFSILLVTRGVESILRRSWFRPGYELFYAPIPADEKRTAKPLIDVACDRLGDAAGGALVRVALVLLPGVHGPTILAFASACSIGAIVAASRLNRSYIGSLRNNLANRERVAAAPPPSGDRTTRSLMRALLQRESLGNALIPSAQAPAAPEPLDEIATDIQHLRSHDRGRVVRVLDRDDNGLDAALVPHVIPLLAWDPVAEHATFALRKVAEEHVGQFVDALLDPNHDCVVRRRLARVFTVCVSQRAVDGLLIALDDLRFAVRSQAARSLLTILQRNPLLRLDRERVLDVVLKEVTVGRPVWEGRRVLDARTNGAPLDAFVRDRAGESLAHVFTLLSLALPREPIQLAFRGLQTDDERLRATALEYLDTVLPPAIRLRLWPFIERQPSRHQGGRHREEAIAALLGSNQSIESKLEELRRRAPLPAQAGAWTVSQAWTGQP